MKIFLALLISLAYAAKYPNSNPNRSIERASRSRFDQLDSDTFYCIITFLYAEEVFDLKFVSKGFYNRVKKIWPTMRLFTVIRNVPQPRTSFSHAIEIDEIVRLEGQAFFPHQVQLKYLREFSIVHSFIYNLQDMINLLPKNSLTSLRLQILGLTRRPITSIDFPNLTHLKLSSNIILSHGTFSSLPNCMKVLEVNYISMDDAASSSLATRLKAMDKLEALSLSYCTVSKNGFSAILENLPSSLKRLDIDSIRITESGSILPNFGFERLKEMKSLQSIRFYGVEDTKLAHEIISNLPECITEIECFMDAGALCAFQKRASKQPNVFKNVTMIDFYWIPRELFLDFLKIFPNLDEDIKNYNQ